jgi:hypothetical protein
MAGTDWSESMNVENPNQIILREKRREELATVTFNQNGQMFQPKDGRELMDMANLMSTAGLMVKDIYRNNPGACMGLIAVCAPYGMNPLQVSWKTYQTKADGPVAYEAQVIVAMVNGSGAVQGGLRYRYEAKGKTASASQAAFCAAIISPLKCKARRLGKSSRRTHRSGKPTPTSSLPTTRAGHGRAATSPKCSWASMTWTKPQALLSAPTPPAT